VDELSFIAGDLIMLKARLDTQWLKGKLISGQEGIFPKKFVEIVVRSTVAMASYSIMRFATP